MANLRFESEIRHLKFAIPDFKGTESGSSADFTARIGETGSSPQFTWTDKDRHGNTEKEKR